MLKYSFLTILVAKVKFWDHILRVTTPLLLLRSGLRFSFQPLEIGFLAILHFINQKNATNCRKMPFMVITLMKKIQNTQNHKQKLLWKWWSISVWGAHQSINKQALQLESHLYRIFLHICMYVQGILQNFTTFLPILFNPSW